MKWRPFVLAAAWAVLVQACGDPPQTNNQAALGKNPLLRIWGEAPAAPAGVALGLFVEVDSKGLEGLTVTLTSTDAQICLSRQIPSAASAVDATDGGDATKSDLAAAGGDDGLDCGLSRQLDVGAGGIFTAILKPEAGRNSVLITAVLRDKAGKPLTSVMRRLSPEAPDSSVSDDAGVTDDSVAADTIPNAAETSDSDDSGPLDAGADTQVAEDITNTVDAVSAADAIDAVEDTK